MPSSVQTVSPLVGRHRELLAFRAALHQVANGQPTVLRVSGEIGIGRTRLLQHFAVMAQGHPATVLSVGGDGRDDEPLGPLRRSVLSEALAPLAQAIGGHDGNPFDRLIDAMAAVSRETPLWILFDDLHAAEDASRALITRLLAALHHGPLHGRRIGLVLSLLDGDDDELQQQLDQLDREGSATRLELHGFDRDEVRSWLISRFALTADADLINLLTEASAGNPLLLAELTMHLQRSHVLREKDGYVSASISADGAALPRDLADLVQHKIESVSSECRLAMTVASLIGNEFEPDTLANLLEQELGGLEQILREAEKARLVARNPSGTVRFNHAADRQHLYGVLDEQNREEAHLQIGERLIGEFGERADEHCLSITHHLIRAGGRADPAAVLHYASRAGQTAFGHHSYFLSGRYYEAAARAGAGLVAAGEQAALYCSAGESYQRWADGERSTICFASAAALYDQCGDLSGHARALQGMLRNQVAYGELDAASADVANRLMGMLGRLPRDALDLRIRVHDTLAVYHQALARYDVAEAYARNAMSIASEADDPALRCIPVTSLALAQMEQFRLSEAKATWLEGLSYARAAGDARYEGFHLQRLPMPLFCIGDVPEAARYNQTSYQHNRAIGNTGELCINLVIDVMIANLRGDFDAAVAVGNDAIELVGTTRYLWTVPPLVAALAYALTMRERYDEAQAVVAHLTTDGVIFSDARPYQSAAQRLERLIAVHRRGAVSGASADSVAALQTTRAVRLGSVGRLCAEVELALLEQATQRLDGVHDTLEFVHRRGVALLLGWSCSVPRSLGVAAALRGNRGRAEDYFHAAHRLAQRCGAPMEQARVDLYRGLSMLAGPNPDVDTARDELHRALEGLGSFRAPALLRLGRAALARCDGPLALKQEN